MESGWIVWVWLVGVVSRRRVWLVGEVSRMWVESMGVVVRMYTQTVQVSRFQRDPPDFTRSVPLPDVLPSGILKIARSSPPLAHYYNEPPRRGLDSASANQ